MQKSQSESNDEGKSQQDNNHEQASTEKIDKIQPRHIEY
jgi:hypothetical protein